MLSAKCPTCGGTNIFDEKKQIPTYCSFCGGHLPDMTKFVQESLQLGLDKQRYTMEINKMDKEIKRAKVMSIPEILTSAWKIIAGIVMLLLSIGVFIMIVKIFN